MEQDSSLRKTKFKNNSSIFKCPICQSKMNIYDLKDLVCENRHSFNIARKGYVNFLLKPVKTEYDEEMFYSRNVICESGFFNPMLEYITDLIVEKFNNNDLEKFTILDAGCGEGFHLGKVIKNLRSENFYGLQGVGIDISKEGILIASKNYFDIIWCVGDLANLPFMNKKFSVILNILSPANYKEFTRTLKNDGLLIKVVPGNNYLKELRKSLYKGMNKETYSNRKVIENFSKNFKVIDVKEIQYKKEINQENLKHLVKMTPLSWSAKEKEIKKVLNMNIKSITVDFTIIIGKN